MTSPFTKKHQVTHGSPIYFCIVKPSVAGGKLSREKRKAKKEEGTLQAQCWVIICAAGFSAFIYVSSNSYFPQRFFHNVPHGGSNSNVFFLAVHVYDMLFFSYARVKTYSISSEYIFLMGILL